MIWGGLLYSFVSYYMFNSIMLVVKEMLNKKIRPAVSLKLKTHGANRAELYVTFSSTFPVIPPIVIFVPLNIGAAEPGETSFSFPLGSTQLQLSPV